jgi:hypothetical protein
MLKALSKRFKKWAGTSRTNPAQITAVTPSAPGKGKEKEEEVVPSSSAGTTTTATTTQPVGQIKSKRNLADSISKADLGRYAKNNEATDEALAKIYDRFYGKNGQRLSDKDPSQELYSLMGKGPTDYLKEGVSAEDFERFRNLRNTNVFSQAITSYEKAMNDYSKEFKEYPAQLEKYADYREQLDRYKVKLTALQAKFSGDPAQLKELQELQEPKRVKKPTSPVQPHNPGRPEEVAKKGDYFHVENNNSETRDHLTGNARRIIVNVKTQQAGLKIAHSLHDLYQDEEVSRYFRNFKIYLATNPHPQMELKYDKIVIYYRFPPAKKDGPDVVGDRIVTTVLGAVSEDDFDPKLSPFYSRIADGIAWAEEPKYFVQGLDDSFTEARRDTIARVIRTNLSVGSEIAFKRLVLTAIDTDSVNPEFPHRHVTHDPMGRRLTPQPAPKSDTPAPDTPASTSETTTATSDTPPTSEPAPAPS